MVHSGLFLIHETGTETERVTMHLRWSTGAQSTGFMGTGTLPPYANTLPAQSAAVCYSINCSE
ncbi:hypothetical protein [Paenibacillus polymyxa]|uniref:hypothetical protein n=1 Tax=Paenibacillus polymyxa TaxID=1406 RepID=UPI0032166B7D